KDGHDYIENFPLFVLTYINCEFVMTTLILGPKFGGNRQLEYVAITLQSLKFENTSYFHIFVGNPFLAKSSPRTQIFHLFVFSPKIVPQDFVISQRAELDMGFL
ncbi:hypothetical protein ACQP3J_27805, partial [Escherichia coli]